MSTLIRLTNNYLSLFVLYLSSLLFATKDLLLALTMFFLVNAILTLCVKIKFATHKKKRYNISILGVLYDFIFSMIVIVLSKAIDDFVLPFDGDHFVKFTSSVILFSEFISILKKFSIFTKNKMYSQISNVLDVKRKKIITNH